ncbi:sigma-70 family RNA polymerase sigma factor [Chitinophaga sp. SYP-B3965]|uniref:RNA polymerase sigma factor n=1 Tax=Chitinophaga sp. SYP-B3965 TaxID=2663120 RepID=UPI001299A3B1|nr:sigma-70 family RNA polymerase sigma factor [Chitinophaga sp. SYP-B3965]MRG47921.1 sigma-70 family RNA polymerase sigma factor [Chitinophaga sp. SYP-B3965]
MIEIAALRQGSEPVFEQVFHAYQDKLYGYFLKHTRSNMLSEELVQNTFIKLWDYRTGLNEDLELSAQIFRIARTCMIDQIRERKSRKRLTDAYEQEIIQLQQLLQESNIDYKLQLQKEISRMPPVRKKVFLLNKVNGLSHKEIAGLLSISPRTVETHIHKALQQLRKAMLSILY